MPIHSTPPRMLRREDVLAARLKTWESRTDDQAMFRFGDSVASKLRPVWDGLNAQPSDLWTYGFRRAGWWVKPRLDSVVFRPYLNARKDLSLEDGGVYDYDMKRGTFILLWGSSYGVPCKRSLIYWPGDGRHYREMISEENKK
ncbi:hypothetical protein [Sphingomonas phage Carli]|nr:hypothetical protein [Sphingomonas phage Carli]